MRIKLKTQEKTKWHDWFAWYPIVTLSGYLVWLETVERRVLYESKPDFSGHVAISKKRVYQVKQSN